MLHAQMNTTIVKSGGKITAKPRITARRIGSNIEAGFETLVFMAGLVEEQRLVAGVRPTPFGVSKTPGHSTSCRLAREGCWSAYAEFADRAAFIAGPAIMPYPTIRQCATVPFVSPRDASARQYSSNTLHRSKQRNPRRWPQCNSS